MYQCTEFVLYIGTLRHYKTLIISISLNQQDYLWDVEAPHEERQWRQACSRRDKEDVKNAPETLKDNIELDLPDKIFSLAPYSTQIILGVRLIFDLMHVNGDFSKVEMTQKTRIAVMKVLVLMSGFGVTTILTIAASAEETAAPPGIGTAVGGVGGGVTASLINKKISPYTLELAYKFLNLTPEDMFYYKNMEKINALAISFKEGRSSFLGGQLHYTV